MHPNQLNSSLAAGRIITDIANGKSCTVTSFFAAMYGGRACFIGRLANGKHRGHAIYVVETGENKFSTLPEDAFIPIKHGEKVFIRDKQYRLQDKVDHLVFVET